MVPSPQPPTVVDLVRLLRPFCERHGIRRLEVFGSVARDTARPGSDVDLLVTFDDPDGPSTGELLEMAGEVEELVGAPVDFVVRSHLEKSPNRISRDLILATAVPLYGS